MTWYLDVPVLDGELVRLEPLGERHVVDLRRAAGEDRSSFEFTVVPEPGEVEQYLRDHEERAKQGLTAFAQVRVSDGVAVGCTSFWNPREWPDRDGLRAIEIGWTWLAASAQGTGINVEAKLLLFTYAFETLGVARVDTKTDARNERSRVALERLGVTFEGVVRSWSFSWAPGEEGRLRDSAMFSVVESEWPSVKEGLVARVARYSGG